MGTVGDPGAVLQQLTAAIEPAPDRTAWLGRVENLRHSWAEYVRKQKPAPPCRFGRIMREVSDALPEGPLSWWTSVSRLYRPAAAWPSTSAARACAARRVARLVVPGIAGRQVRPAGPACGLFHRRWRLHVPMEMGLRYGIQTITAVNNNASFSQERFLWRDEAALARNWRFPRWTSPPLRRPSAVQPSG